MIAKTVREFLPQADLLPYLEAILRTLQPARPARQQVEGAAEDPGARGGDRDGAGARRGGVRGAPGRDGAGQPGAASPRSRRPSRRRSSSRRRTLPPLVGAGLRAWVDTNVTAHRVAALRDRHGVAEADRRHAGRRDGRPDAAARRPGRGVRARRAAGQPRAEHRAAARAAAAPAGDLCAAEGGGARDGERRADLRHHRLPGHGLLRAGDGAVDPGGAGDRGGVRRPRPAARHRADEDQDLGLHQRLRAPPRRAYRHPRARPGGGGELPDHARRRRHRDGGDRREGRATASPTTRSCRRWSG